MCFWKEKSFPLLFPSVYTYLPLWNLKRTNLNSDPGRDEMAESGSGGKWIKHVRVFIERILSTEIFLHFNKFWYDGTKKSIEFKRLVVIRVGCYSNNFQIIIIRIICFSSNKILYMMYFCCYLIWKFQIEIKFFNIYCWKNKSKNF